MTQTTDKTISKLNWQPKRYAKIFAPDQEEITRQNGGALGSGAFSVWVRLNTAGYNSNGKFFPEPTSDLKFATGLSRNTIFQAVKLLENMKFIEVRREKKSGSTQNEINQFRILRNIAAIKPPSAKSELSHSVKSELPPSANFQRSKPCQNLHPSSLVPTIKEEALSRPPPFMDRNLLKSNTRKRQDFFSESAGAFKGPASEKSVVSKSEEVER